MIYHFAHAGEDHASETVVAAETGPADMLLPIIIITLVAMVALVAVAALLSRKKKAAPKTTKQDQQD